MNKRNICKFPSSPLSESMSISCFVLETDKTVMSKNHTLKDHCAILVSSGKVKFKFSDKVYTADVGSLIFCFRGEEYSAVCEGEASYMYICFSGNRADELFYRFDIKATNRIFDGFDGLIPLWNESLLRASEKTADLASESILLYTFSRLSGSVADLNSLVNKVVEITEQSFTDTDLSINSIAEELSYNPKYVSHIFKKKMGISFSEYLRTLRIKFAVSLFERGIVSVKNVALLSGFSDPLYFSTVFKKTVGMSPKEYKNRLIKTAENDN